MEGFGGRYGRGSPHFSQASMDFPDTGLRFSESETSQFVLFDQAGTDGVIYSERMVPVAYNVPDALGLTGESNLETVLTSAGLQDHVCDLEIYKQAMAVAFDEFEKSRDPFDSNEQQSLATSSSCWHENTEDLNALMDSDDEPELNSESVTSGLTHDRGNTGGDELEVFESGYISSEGETSGGGGRCHLRSSSELLSVRSKRFRKSGRRMLIRNKIQLLKNIIPGGQQMETTGVLEETIRYIRALQAMVGGLDQQPVSKMGAQGF